MITWMVVDFFDGNFSFEFILFVHSKIIEIRGYVSFKAFLTDHGLCGAVFSASIKSPWRMDIEKLFLKP